MPQASKKDRRMENQPTRVWIVQSDPDHQADLVAHLTQHGYAPELLPDGDTVLTRIEREPVPLLLLALGLWGTSSYQVLERLATRGMLRATTVMMLTPSDDAPGLEQCLELGASDYLPLPLSPALLARRLAQWEQQRHLRDQESEQARKETLLKIERDVQIARNIQQGFLPDQLPQPAGWEIAAGFHPARDVAGDFYDAFMLTQNRRLGVVIADVCDKGVGAALFMSLSRSLIRSFSQVNQTLGWTDVLSAEGPGLRPRNKPDEERKRARPAVGVTALKSTVTHVNNYITDNHIDMNMFVTLFFGVLDPATGVLVYVNGGHVPPVIIHPDGSTETLPITGPAVGMMPGATFEIGEAQLDPGDTLYCYTDGVTDARAPSREFFGDDRVQALLKQPASSARALIQRIEARLQAHIANAEQFDDITMLVLRRHDTA